MSRRLSQLIVVIPICCGCTPGKVPPGTGAETVTTMGDSAFRAEPPPSSAFRYDLDKAGRRYAMPGELREISGIAWHGEAQLACVQDEDAEIYVFDLNRGDVVWQRDFGAPGDYEDIALAGDTAWVIRSDGRLFEVRAFSSARGEVREYNTPLSGRNDTEGLCYDSLTRSLLIACKASPDVGEDRSFSGTRAVYRFDLMVSELDQDPYLLVDPVRLNPLRQSGFLDRISLVVLEKLSPGGNEVFFHPSGIAVHPLYDEIYLISAVGRMLIIMDRQGNVLHVRKLDSRLFRQPEGICFSPSGDLYIASEGRGGEGYILIFEQVKDQ